MFEMKTNLSLKAFIITAFLLTGMALVFGYSLLSKNFYHKGMESITSLQLEGLGEKYRDLVPLYQRQDLQFFDGHFIAPRWELMPPKIREVFGKTAPVKRLTIKAVHRGWFGPPEGAFILWHYEHGDEQYYISRQDRPPTRRDLLAENTERSWNLLAIIGVITMALLALLSYFLYFLISRPIITVEKWASSLSADNFNQDVPDFVFPELNKIARLMKASLTTVQQSLVREQKFLQHASHELRTPIAVIRNNVELFGRLQEQGQYDKQERIIARIDRASHNMEDITETILWASRGETENLREERFDIAEMVREGVADLSYLLDRKNIELKVETTQQELLLPRIPVQIIISNLIRNAFQHSWDGSIYITQIGSQLLIVNPRVSSQKGKEDLGFGLGLKLAQQLIEKLGSSFIDQSTEDFYRVQIIFDSENSCSTNIQDEPGLQDV